MSKSIFVTGLLSLRVLHLSMPKYFRLKQKYFDMLKNLTYETHSRLVADGWPCAAPHGTTVYPTEKFSAKYEARRQPQHQSR